MRNWKEVLVAPATPLHDVLNLIDKAGTQISLVVDPSGRLLGTLSDGDVRRALLKGMGLAEPVSKAMYSTPTCAARDEERGAVLAKMRRLGLHQIPILDEERRVVGLETLDDFLSTPPRSNWVVLMAGGLGTRLAELTRDTPKPMLKVGPRPLLESIVRGYAEQGFQRFYLAVNYKAEQIETHFGDGSAFGVQSLYLRERQRMGTAGALSLLPEQPSEPFIVANGDLLTKEDYGRMLDRHVASGADMTMAVRDYEMQVPFGVVRERDGYIEAIEEKPTHSFLVSAGIYVLSPTVLDLIPSEQFFDMPSLFDAAIARGLKARTHQIDGYWLDIGRRPDYDRANSDYDEVFR